MIAEEARALAPAPKPRAPKGRSGGAEEEAEETRRTATPRPPPRARRGHPFAAGRDGRDRRESRAETEAAAADGATAEGVVELLGNGSGFLRVNAAEPSDDDVYISAAQVRRCELVSGDPVTGPVRAPRRSERYPSLVRIDTINGRPADEVAEGTPFEELPCALPDRALRARLARPDAEGDRGLAPFGRGSRVDDRRRARAGKSEALRRLARALRRQEGLEVVALAGVRPEEVALARPARSSRSRRSSPRLADAQGQAVDRAIEPPRIAARGGHAVC